MKIFSLTGMLTLSAVASATLAAPQRFARDVNELIDTPLPADSMPPVTEYLPIEMQMDVDAAAATEVPSALRGAQGYEYRTVRRLKLRHRTVRDVSHLQPANHYLPPPPAQPSKAYLPPAVIPTTAAPAPAPASAPADDTEEVVSAAEPKVAREYLPPVEPTEAAVEETEAPATEQPDVRVVDVPVADLQADGYHYMQPAEMPAELREAARDYLPPLGADDVMVEGPPDGESAVLTKDGYQYRAVRRYRF
ncbi:calphotin [Drosophila busckii]|uniref:calphotin n=1 Tax=Drosophila busckii TaxID=30019 RepID=UPI001432E580|nr:calphotin [Drosophila busckii]